MKLTLTSFAHSLLVSAFALAAPSGFGAGTGPVKSLPKNVTFTEHVAPILFQNY